MSCELIVFLAGQLLAQKKPHEMPSKTFWRKLLDLYQYPFLLMKWGKLILVQTGRLHTSKSESEQKFLGLSERVMLGLESIHLGFYLKRLVCNWIYWCWNSQINWVPLLIPVWPFWLQPCVSGSTKFSDNPWRQKITAPSYHFLFVDREKHMCVTAWENYRPGETRDCCENFMRNIFIKMSLMYCFP